MTFRTAPRASTTCPELHSSREAAEIQVCGSNGYIVLSGSLLLGLGGFWILNRGMSHTYPDFCHVHIVVGDKPIPVLMWPTFESSLWLLAPAYFYSLSEFARHRSWAVFHTIAAYMITLQRVNVVVVNLAGRVMYLLPDKIQRDSLKLPVSHEGKAAAELGAFAWTAWYGGILAFMRIVYEWRALAF